MRTRSSQPLSGSSRGQQPPFDWFAEGLKAFWELPFGLAVWGVLVVAVVKAVIVLADPWLLLAMAVVAFFLVRAGRS